MHRWLDYFQLMRIPNVFTAIADSAMGFMLVSHPSQDGVRFAACLLASSLLYVAGMVLNDYYDLELDRVERPERPLPAGRVSPTIALRLGLALIVGGAISGNCAGTLPGHWVSSAGLVALVLANLILIYDRRLKSTALGPVAMGGCRALNVWMAATIGMATRGTDAVPTAEPLMLIVAGVGLYVAGITWFARDEATTSQRQVLGMASGVMCAGLALVAVFPYVGGGLWQDRIALRPQATWPILVLFLAASPLRRWWLAWQQPEPARVRLAVKQSILFLIVLDAAIVLALHGPLPALLVLGLLIPATVLSQWFAAT